MTTSGRSNHFWGHGARLAEDELESRCKHCALIERQVWLLDDEGRAVAGLAWIRPGGSAVAVRPFAFSKNRRPQNPPTRSWAQVYPDVPVTGSPQCPKSPDGW